MPTHERCFQR
jgi:hypothetical protein